MGRGEIDLLWEEDRPDLEEDRPDLEQNEEYLKAAAIVQISSTGRLCIVTRDRTG